jgi:hypothetical protein
MAKRKLYGLCKTCKDRVECFTPIRRNEDPEYDEEKPPCDARNEEIFQKFFNWTDEYGNTGMYKLDLTKEERLELDDWLGKEEYRKGNAFETYRRNLRYDKYRHDRSEYNFKTTGVRTPTPDICTVDDIEDWYVRTFKQKGVCKDCIIRMCCSKMCDAKREERNAVWEREDRIDKNGLCKECELRLSCQRQSLKCIERAQEIERNGERES